MTSREIVALAYRYKLILGAYFVAPIIFAALLFGDADPVWRATARLHLGGETSSHGLALLSAERAFLTAPDLVDAMIAKFGAARLFPDAAPAVEDVAARRAAFSHAYDVDLDSSHDDIALAYRAPTPELARAVLSAVIAAYLEQRLAPFDPAVGSAASDQVAKLEARVHDLDQRAGAFRAEQNYFDPDEQRRHLLQQRDALTDERSHLRSHIAELQGQAEALRLTVQSQAHPMAEAAPDIEAVAGARAKLVTLQSQFHQMATEQGDDSPALKPLQDQMDALRSFLRTHAEMASDGDADAARRQLVQTQAGLKSDQAQLPAIETQMSEVDQALRALQQVAVRAAQLDRDRDDAAKELDIYRDRLRAQAGGSGNREAAGVTIIQPPLGETSPAGPSLIRYIGAGLGLSFLGCGLSFLALVAGSGRVLIPETLERRFGLPILATLPGER